MSILLMKAALFAAEGHKYQMRKKLGVPYINHPLQVAAYAAECGFDESHVIIAMCHDLIEDTDVTSKDIQAEFGGDIAYGVTLLTKWWGDHAPKDWK